MFTLGFLTAMLMVFVYISGACYGMDLEKKKRDEEEESEDNK